MPEAKTYDFESFLNDSELLISGTGWESNLEHNARKKASQANIYSVAVIDHWVNYKLRFGDQQTILPNEIVTDKYAFDLAKNISRDTNKTLPNYYLEDITKKIKYLDSNKEK